MKRAPVCSADLHLRRRQRRTRVQQQRDAAADDGGRHAGAAQPQVGVACRCPRRATADSVDARYDPADSSDTMPGAGGDDVRLDRQVVPRRTARAVGARPRSSRRSSRAVGVERADGDRGGRVAGRGDAAEHRRAGGGQAVVAGRDDDDEAGLDRARDRAAQRIGRGRLGDRVTERQVDDADAVASRDWRSPSRCRR